ncbi:MAG: exonuclease SbcCD subunit D [Nocardioides alkalitolerans]
MRILHTSDWHLGRSFHRADLLGHQAAFVDHLLEVVVSEGVDLVVVAGDVYDRALPPVDAVRLADDAIARLAATPARVVVSSGNHDSARRLGFGARVMDAAGVHVRTDPAGVGVPVLVEDRHGPVAVHALPYLDPDAVREPWGLAARSHEAALGAAMQRVRADLAGRPGTRSVVLAHAFVAGAQPSESERDIAVGGVDRVPTSVFDGVDYVALGHLHSPHVLDDRLRYSGSPLAYSFSEAAQTKGSWLVDLAADGSVRAELVPAPVPRRLARLRGTLEELLADPTLAGHEDAWVQATLTDPVRPRGAMDRLRRRFPHALVLGFESSDRPAGLPPRPTAGRGAHDVTLDFVSFVRGTAADAAEAALLATACEACTGDREADPVQGPVRGPAEVAG